MNLRKIILSQMIIILFSLSTMAYAKVIYSFSCGGKSVKFGDTTYSVIKKCGEPAYKEVISKESEDCDKVEKWHYDCKKRKNIDILIFRKGILEDRFEGERTEGVQECE